jgi:N-acetylneuraminic acid mutarotase
LICDNLPDLPFGINFATGQLYNRKLPIICGGYGSSYHCECHSLKDGAWQSMQSLNECRDALASAIFSNPNNNDEDDILLITGGNDGSKVLSTVESFDGNVWNQTMFADLPTTIEYHCLVKINNTMLLQIGGTIDNTSPGTTDKTYFFNIVQNKWIPGPKLNTGRIYHSCAVMNWMNPKTNTVEKVRYL